ncbi:MAG: hypothetical protein IPI67_16335 [Myxococcales bacterium]|nr:hypothetical protein [Myxococcales bacterium]
MKSPLRYAGYASAGLILGAALASACSASDSGSGPGGGAGVGGTNGTGATGGTGAGGAAGTGGGAATDGGGTGGGLNLDGGLNDGKIDPDAACDLQKYQATVTKQPMDIIFVVDNSCSMSNEMVGVQNNINTNFAQIIAQSGIDFRVIVIGEHGPAVGDQSLCIGPPLGGKPCTGVTANTAPGNNPPVFYQYDHDDVESWDSWCKMMDWYNKPDRYNLAPNGWTEWLRKEAFKTFVEVTDDQANCTLPTSSSTYYPSCSSPGSPLCYSDGNSASTGQSAAQQFDKELLALDPVQFGTAQARNYVWHSVVGIAKNPNNTTGLYEPTDPITLTECSTAVQAGTGYQALSILTGGLRYPVCEGLGFDVLFKKIAEGVIKGAKIQCDFPMPDPPAGKELDPKTIQIEYTPSAGGSSEKFSQVADATACKPGAFYIIPGGDAGGDAGGGSLVLCADTCTKVQGDNQANIEIVALCKSGGPN